MRRILVIPLLALILGASCTRIGAASQFREAESLLAASPDSALTLLERVRPEGLSVRDRARHTLLSARAFAGTYGFYDVSAEPDLVAAAEYLDRRGSRTEAMQAWTCLGRTQMAAEAWGRAIVSLSRAERIARSLKDYAALGAICNDMAGTYAASYTLPLAARKHYEAIDAFTRAGDEASVRAGLLAYGNDFRALGQMEEAGTVFRSVLSSAHEAADTLTQVRALEALAGLAVEGTEQDPDLAVDLLERVSGPLRSRLSCEDMGVLAYAWSLKGMRGYSLYWLRLASANAETPAQRADYEFRRYQIESRAGHYEEALSALEQVTDYTNRTDARQGAVTSQLDFLAEQERLEAGRARTSRMSFWALVLLIAGIGASLIWYAKARRLQQERFRSEQQAERERYMALAEDLQAQLSRMKEKDRAPAVPKLDVLERLCEQYYVYEGTDNLQPKVMKEVRSIVDGLRNDPKVQRDLERSLDRSADNVMTRLRTAFPAWKEEDYRLYAFAAAGFSSTTMSLLVEKDKPYVYNRIYRIKGRIQASDLPDKDFFLEKLGK